MADQAPKWTVFYNIPGQYVGTGWEFFLEEEEAKKRMDKLNEEGRCAGMRRFWPGTDLQHLGAAHKWDEWHPLQVEKAKRLQEILNNAIWARTKITLSSMSNPRR